MPPPFPSSSPHSNQQKVECTIFAPPFRLTLIDNQLDIPFIHVRMVHSIRWLVRESEWNGESKGIAPNVSEWEALGQFSHTSAFDWRRFSQSGGKEESSIAQAQWSFAPRRLRLGKPTRRESIKWWELKEEKGGRRGRRTWSRKHEYVEGERNETTTRIREGL